MKIWILQDIGRLAWWKAPLLFAIAAGLSVLLLVWTRAGAGPDPSPTTILRNGWMLSPAGTLVGLPGDMPLKIVTSSDGREALIVTGGYHDHSLEVLDVGAGKVVQQVNLGKAWAGLTLEDSSGAVYVAGGGPPSGGLRKRPDLQGIDERIAASLTLPVLRLELKSGRLEPRDGVAIPGLDEKERFTAGLAMTPQALFVANIENDTVYKLNRDTRALEGSAKVGYRPYQIAVSRDGSTLAVGEWGASSVALLNTADLSLAGRIAVGVHPTDVAFAPDGRLFVANAGADSVSVIRGGRVVESVSTALSSGPIGATPCSLALSRDGSRLYVANSGENDVEVVDISRPDHSVVLGFIPTGQYPSAVAVTPDGKNLVIGIAKGLGSGPNVPTSRPAPRTQADPKHPFDYIGWLVQGFAEIVHTPDGPQLARLHGPSQSRRPGPQAERSGCPQR